jgi:hypothetical protein
VINVVKDREALIDAMRAETGEKSSMLLAKLRMGTPIEELVALLCMDFDPNRKHPKCYF